MAVPMLRVPHAVLPAPAAAVPNMAVFGQGGPMWQQGGRERCIAELAGAWRNVDMPGERYEVRGLKVIRTDARGTREFSLHWDARLRRWRWGPHGRLLLLWVADDAIAWVPEQASGAKDARAWRWERCIHTAPPLAASAAASSYEPWRPNRHQERQRYTTATRRMRRSWSRERSRRNHSRERSRRHRRHSSRDRRHGGQSYERRHHSSRWVAEANTPLPCGLTQRELHDLLFREITPEDYDLLCRLDVAVAKPTDGGAAAAKVTNAVENLPCLSEEEFKGSSCSICLTFFEASDAVPDLPCRHHFHRECLARWLAERPGRPTCPLCCKEVLEVSSA